MNLYKKSQLMLAFQKLNYFFMPRTMSFTISTIGITKNAIPIEITYWTKVKAVRENTPERGLTKTNKDERTNETPPANQSILFWLFIVKIEPFNERILNAWNTSAIESVINAIVVANNPLLFDST